MLGNKLLNLLIKKKITFFSGVPDSVLSDFIKLIEEKRGLKHIISSNEGTAVSTAIGHYLATKKIPCVYLQNSGLGNAINPLISIAHEKVYSIPLILIIGWRGAPGIKDEPQHKVKGNITLKLLKLLDINCISLDNGKNLKLIEKEIGSSIKNNKSIAILVKKNEMSSNQIKKKINKKLISRPLFIQKLLNKIPKNYNLISTTGYTSRELHQIRSLHNLKKGKDFYMVGGMGHASSVALGVNIAKKKVICLDGDGSILMHLGSLLANSINGNNNFKHILLNNNSHESVGSFKTNVNNINFKLLIKSLKYKNYFKLNKIEKADFIIKKFLQSKGPSFLEVIISEGTIKNLSRPKDLKSIKNKFIKSLKTN